MTVATVSALLTQGIGPKGSIPLLLTEGLLQGPALSGIDGGFALTKKEAARLKKRARERREKEEQRWLEAAENKIDLKAAHLPQDIKPIVEIDDDEDAELEILLLHG